MQEKDNGKKINKLSERLFGKGRIYRRVRNINLLVFVLAFVLMLVVMLSAFGNIVGQVASDNAGRYAASTADAFSANIVKEIGLMGKAARSDAIVSWLSDEGNAENKILAFEELSGIIGELYSNVLYVGFAASQNYYIVSEEDTISDLWPFASFHKANPSDAWFFEIISSEKDYILNIGTDDLEQQTRVWLNYNVLDDGVSIGTLSTWLDFSYISGELFSQYNSASLRGLIIDENGTVNMDSAVFSGSDFEILDFEMQIEEELSDPVFLDMIRSHLDSVEGVFEVRSEPLVIELRSDPYRFATVAEIRATPWSVVLLYNPSAFLSMSLFLPIIAILVALLLAFAITLNMVSTRQIFRPLARLVGSLVQLKEDSEASVYGIERDDEIGNLSNTIVDLFTKANFDALTGIYNRHYMTANFSNLMHILSRSDGVLSVLMLDVDFFKNYNDEYGHDKGDHCLRAVAKALDDSLTRKEDFVARFGGEEFVAVLMNTDETGARIIANRMLDNVRALNIPHAKSDISGTLTISAGLTSGKVLYTQSYEDFIKRADEALYMSKQGGRDRYTFLPIEDFAG